MPNTNKRTQFDKIQAEVLRLYNEGDHLVFKKDDIANCGDGLLKFLLVELSAGEDCKDVETAVQRLGSAIDQLTDLRDKLAGGI